MDIAHAVIAGVRSAGEDEVVSLTGGSLSLIGAVLRRTGASVSLTVGRHFDSTTHDGDFSVLAQPGASDRAGRRGLSRGGRRWFCNANAQ